MAQCTIIIYNNVHHNSEPVVCRGAFLRRISIGPAAQKRLENAKLEEWLRRLVGDRNGNEKGGNILREGLDMEWLAIFGPEDVEKIKKNMKYVAEIWNSNCSTLIGRENKTVYRNMQSRFTAKKSTLILITSILYVTRLVFKTLAMNIQIQTV